MGTEAVWLYGTEKMQKEIMTHKFLKNIERKEKTTWCSGKKMWKDRAKKCEWVYRKY